MLRLAAEEKRGPEKRELGKRDGAGRRASDDGWRATASLDCGGPELRNRLDQQPGQQVGQSVAEFVVANIPLFKLFAAAGRCAGSRRFIHRRLSRRTWNTH